MSEVTIYCPPAGNTIAGECQTTEVLTWSLPSVEYVQYYVPSINEQMIAFELSNVLNNGSSVTVEIIYYRDNVEIIAQTWELGELGNNETLYHYLDFGTTTGVNNYITLKVSLVGGSSGEIDFYLDCDVQIAKQVFCTGTTAIDVCDCNFETESVTIYAVYNGGFPFIGVDWYLDPKFQNEAPCLYYQTNLGNIYYYNCITSTSSFIGVCPSNQCPLIECSGGTSSFVHTNQTFTVSNPYPENYKGEENTIAEGFPNAARFSKHCLVVKFPNNTAAYPITFTFAYNQGNSVDYRYITLEDAFKDQSADAPGYLSYSLSDPATAPFFESVLPESLIRMPIVTNTITIWVIPPASGVVLIKFFVGYKDVRTQNKAVMTTTITPTCNGVNFHGYEMGLHVYSAWDALNSPRLKTFLYSFTPLANWVENQTIVFNDPYFLQPAFPYFYSMSGVTYKIGDPLRRDYGFLVEYVVRKRVFSKWKYVNKTVSEFKNHTITDLFSGQKQLPTCVHMVATMGKITNIIQENEVIEPLTYSYIVGKDNTIKVNSNNNYFNLLDPEDRKLGCYIATGLEYALARLSTAYHGGLPKYLDDFSSDIRNRFRGLDEYLQEESPVGSSVLIGLGFAVSASIVFGFRSGFFGRLFGSAVTNGNTVQALADQARKMRRVGRWIGWFWKNDPWNNAATRAPKNKTKWGEFFQWCWDHPKLMLIISIIIVALLLILFVIKINKKVSDCCKLFSFVYTYNPYIFLGDTVNLTPGLTLPYTSGYLCDGAYFYTLSGGIVTNKELSYKIVNDIKTYSVLPDEDEYVITIPDLFFLPFVSGKPNTYVTVPTYESLQINSSSIMSQDIVGELNNPQLNTFTLESGFTTSEISQQDADDAAFNYLSGITAYSQTFYGNITYKPGVSEILSDFTHEIKEEIAPNQILFFYDDSDLSGVTIGKTLYYDSGGVSSLLNGYYATSAQTSYKVFNYVLSGNVEDIFVMQNSGDTTVISTLTGGTINISQTLTGFTSGWYLTSNEIYDTYTIEEEPNTSLFYSSPNVKRGLIQTPETQQTFYTYDTNIGYPTTYTEAEENWYREFTSGQPFFYYQNADIIINVEQVCSLTGDNGLLFKLVNTSGDTVNSVWGINFIVNIFTASTFDSSHSISINDNETEKLLPLSTSYIGQITDVQLSGYTSQNPINKTTFVYSGFTGCTLPTPTPTPTLTVTPTTTSTLTPTPTSTLTPTPTITPSTSGLPTIYVSVCYDSLIPQDDFIVDFNFYTQSSGDSCGADQTLPLDYLSITFETYPNSPYDPVGGIVTISGNSCVVASGQVLGDNITGFTITDISTPYSNNANYIVGTICSSGSCVTCSSPTPTPTVTQTNTPTQTITETNTPTPTITQTNTPTQTITPSITPNAVCPEQFVLTYSGNNPTGFSGYSGTYDRMYSYTGGSFTVGYYDSLPSPQFVVGPDASGDSYSVFGRNNGSIYYTIIGLSQTTPDNVISWYVLRSTGDYAINGATVTASVQIGATSDNGLLSGGIYFPPTGRIVFTAASIWYRNYPSVCPSPTPTVTPTNTSTPTVTPTNTSTPTITPTITPSSTSILNYCGFVAVSNGDLLDSTGNSSFPDNTVYVNYKIDGIEYTQSFTVAGTSYICGFYTSSATTSYYYKNDVQTIGSTSVGFYDTQCANAGDCSIDFLGNFSYSNVSCENACTGTTFVGIYTTCNPLSLGCDVFSSGDGTLASSGYYSNGTNCYQVSQYTDPKFGSTYSRVINIFGCGEV